MPSTNFKEILLQARRSVQESKRVRTLYSQADEDKLDEIAGLSDIIGLAKKFTPNFQKMGAAVGGVFKSGAKAVWDSVKKDFDEAAKQAVEKMERSKASMDRAIKFGVPEVLAGAPCSFFLLEVVEGKQSTREAMSLIDVYMPDGQGFSDENKNMYDIVYAEVIGESHDRIAEMIVEGWQKSLLVEAAVDDYKDKAAPDWAKDAVKSARSGDYKDVLEAGEFKDDEWLANLLISVILVSTSNDEETMLKMMYVEDPSDADKSNRRKLADKTTDLYVPRIVAMHASFLSEREGSDPANDGLNKEFRGKITGNLKRAWEKSEDALSGWKRFSRKNDKDLGDIAEFAKFLSGKEDDEEDDKARDLRDKFGLDDSPKDMLRKLLSSDEWYDAVSRAESADSERALRAIIGNFQNVVQQNLVELMSPAKISDLSGADKTFKDGFQAFVEAEGTDGYLNKAHEAALQENDDEMMSRLLAQYRPSYVEAYIEEMKSDADFKKLIAPKLEDFKKLVEGNKYGYDSSKDPMWAKMEEILDSSKDQIVDSLEAGLGELEKQRDKAQDEMQKILDAKAEEEGAEEEGPDTSDLRV